MFKNCIVKKFKLQWAFLAAFLLRTIHAWTYYGFKHMDEHWQIIEPANSFLQKSWSITYEWKEGLRSWIYPWFISLFLKFFRFIGIEEPIYTIASLRTVFGLWSLVGIYFACKLCADLCDKYGIDAKKPVLWCAWILALLPYSIYCGTHAHGEMFAAVLVVLSCDLALRKKEFLAGLLLGLTLAIKVDLAVAGFCLGVWYLVSKNFKRGTALLLGALPGLLIMGYVDKLTWGVWFQNALTHAHANLVEEVGNQWGVSPWYTHFIYFLSMTSIFGAVATLALPKIWKKLTPAHKSLWFLCLGFVAVFSFVAHKEKRFMAVLIYIGLAASIPTVFLFLKNSSAFANALKKKNLQLLLAFGLLVHFATDVRNYIIQRPWHDRIHAIRTAAKIPGIEKLFAHQWPAIFYYPTNLPVVSEVMDEEKVAKELRGVNSVGVAHDGFHMRWWENAGFQCRGWPTEHAIKKDPVAAAYLCTRVKR